MKQTLIHISISFLLLYPFGSVNAKKYYFSAISGNDSRSSTQAQSSSTPWKTLSKLNSFFSSLKPGDSILFKCGEVFYGSITSNKSGSTTLPIVFSSYGTGSQPRISGLQTLTNWVFVGNGVYESYNSSLGTTVNMVTLNGWMQSIGRYPDVSAANKGYLSFESHGTNSITDKQLTSATNWTGAEAVVRTKRWILDRRTITAHAGSTLSFSSALTYTPFDNYGYFIQNNIKTLNQFGEWYYNAATKKMNVYFGSKAPSSYTIQASAINTLVTIKSQSNLVFHNLAFYGSNIKAFDLSYTQNITVKNCAFKFSGNDGIFGSSTTNLVVTDTYFNFSNNDAINLNYNCAYASIRYNYIANTGMMAGMGLSGNGSYQGITMIGNNNLVEYNTIYKTGYIAIRFANGSSNVIRNNFIDSFTLTKDDGGGIYTGEAEGSSYTGIKLTNNIILNGIGVSEGTDRPGTGYSSGIDIDDNACNINISSNTISNCRRSGILVHNSFKMTINNNVLYDNAMQLELVHDFAMPDALLRNNVIKNNIFFSKIDSQIVSSVATVANDISLVGVMDSNYYCRPMDDNLTISSSCTIAGLRVDRDHFLANWQTTYNLDKASKRTPIQVPPYVINSLLSSNKFSNGSFNSNITGLYTSPTSTWVSNKLDGGTFQAKTSSTPFATYSVVAGIGAISSKKNYILRFSSQASRDTLLNIYFRLNDAPYTRLSDTKIIPITTSRKENEYLFSLPASSSSTCVLFESKSPNLTFWLDNIQVYEANISVTTPDNYFIFEYNTSERNKTVSLPGTYIDVYNKTHTNSIVIPPYSSVVLIKQTSGNMPVTFENNDTNLLAKNLIPYR